MSITKIKSNSSNDTVQRVMDVDIYFDMVHDVTESWDRIKMIPQYAEEIGVLLFEKIFNLAPDAMSMFSFTDDMNVAERLSENPKLKDHARNIINMLDTTIHLLGPDMDLVTGALVDLGALHVKYGVLPVHYPIFSEALLDTLQEIFTGRHEYEFTEHIKIGWIGILNFVSNTMLKGAEDEKRKGQQQQQQEQERILTACSMENKKDADNPRNNMPLCCCKENCIVSAKEEQVVVKVASGEKIMPKPPTKVTIQPQILFGMVHGVFITWEKVKRIPDFEKVAGILLFKKIFELAPEAKTMFNFSDGYCREEELEKMYESPRFLRHAGKVVSMLDVAVHMLGPDLEVVTETLRDLGAKHYVFGVHPSHYPIVGEALLWTLQQTLGSSWTLTVAEAWKSIYNFISTSMISGARQYLKTRNIKTKRPDKKKVENNKSSWQRRNSVKRNRRKSRRM